MQNTSKYIYSSQVRLLCLHLCQFLLLCFCRNLQCMWREFHLWQCNSRLDLKNWLLNQKFTTTPTIPTYAWWVTISPQKGQGQAAQACHVNILSSESAAMEDCTCHCRIHFVCFWWAPSKIVSSHTICHATALSCIATTTYYNTPCIGQIPRNNSVHSPHLSILGSELIGMHNQNHIQNMSKQFLYNVGKIIINQPSPKTP